MAWLPMHSGHPLMVHLPLIALPLAVLLDAVAVRRPQWMCRDMATILWVLGLAGAAAAVTTGLIAYNRVEHSEAGHQTMTLHRNLALGAAALFLLSAVARWRWPRSWITLGLGLLAVVAITGAGYLGGEIVFRHAIGIPTEVLEHVMMERGGHTHHEGDADAAPAEGDSSKILPNRDSGDTHTHHPETPATP